jgi:hypothetical protein
MFALDSVIGVAWCRPNLMSAPGRHASAGQLLPVLQYRDEVIVCRSIAGARSPSQPIRKYNGKDGMTVPRSCLTEACRDAKENLGEKSNSEYTLHFGREVAT